MWSITERRNNAGDVSGLLLYDFDKTALYVFNSNAMSMELPRSETVLNGGDAVGFLVGLEKKASKELYVDPTWNLKLKDYISEMQKELVDRDVERRR